MNILGLGLPELVVIALVLLLFFGAKRLPGLFRSIGSSINELKTGLNEGEKKIDTDKTNSHPDTDSNQSTESTKQNESAS